MKLTDEKAINALKKVRVYELEEMIDEYPTNEVDGRTDWEMIANEAGWLLHSLESDGYCRYEELEEQKQMLRMTNYGKNPYCPYYGRALSDVEIQLAKNAVNEYNRLKRFVAKLKNMGLYCPNY